MNNNDIEMMRQALRLAQQAEREGEVPVGAILLCQDRVVEAWNQPIKLCDPTAHAEILALRQTASLFNNYRLPNSTLYVTLEPCAMCLGAMIQARIKRLVFGAFDPRAGAVCSVFKILDDVRLNHRIEWKGGILEKECQVKLREFFQARRQKLAQKM